MIASWQELEEFAKDLLEKDNAKMPAGSGSAKKEEDVVGDNVIVQCKYTADKNFSILSKDLDRLIEACDLQQKFPLFLSSNLNSSLLSIPINQIDSELLETFIDFITSSTAIDKLSDEAKIAKTPEQLNAIRVKIQRHKSINKNNLGRLQERLDKILLKVENKYVDLITYNMFEQGEQSATK